MSETLQFGGVALLGAIALTCLRIASILEEIRKRNQHGERELYGLCPHGYLKCFYCWRDAGFPGGTNAS